MARHAAKTFAPKPRSTEAPAVNQEGRPAWTRPLEERYVQGLLTNTLGQVFYAKKEELLAEAEALHAEMVAKDPAFASKAIAYARSEGFMRTQPILGLVHLAGAPGDYFADAFPKVVRTPVDLADFTAILRSKRKGEGGRRVKRVVGRWLIECLNEYWVVKYGAEKQAGTYSLRDLIQVYHPDAGGKVLPLFDYLMGPSAKAPERGKDLLELPKIAAFEALKRAKTDAEKVTAIVEGRLPHEVATPFASGKDVWRAIVPQMPIFALLRNLATIERHGVMADVRDHVVSLLSNESAVKKSKILPFRFVEAEKHVSDSRVKDALRDAVEHSFASVPEIAGETAVLLDISPSMHEPYRHDGMMLTAATFATALMKKSGGRGRLVLFGGEAERYPISMRDSLLTQASAIAKKQNGATNPSAALEVLLETHEKVDSLILITDGQQNRGRPFVDVIDEYRRVVNRNVRLFEVDVSVYGDAVVPPTDPLTFATYGWSDQALRFISLASQGWGSIADVIRTGSAVTTEV